MGQGHEAPLFLCVLSKDLLQRNPKIQGHSVPRSPNESCTRVAGRSFATLLRTCQCVTGRDIRTSVACSRGGGSDTGLLFELAAACGRLQYLSTGAGIYRGCAGTGQRSAFSFPPVPKGHLQEENRGESRIEDASRVQTVSGSCNFHPIAHSLFQALHHHHGAWSPTMNKALENKGRHGLARDPYGKRRCGRCSSTTP